LQFLINGKPFYFKGFGMHEDHETIGKGHDDALAAKDFALLEWIGANSFRTSHYPYAEEIMNMADRLGIVVIDEVPAVGMNMFNRNEKIFCPERVHEKTLEYHLETINELIARDKNHPSVVMWSVANEPASYEDGARSYFKKIAEYTRKLDRTRPITLVNCSGPDECKVAQLFDIVCVNRYFGWYSDPGRLDLIEFQLERDLGKWFARFGKPVFLTEYGADTIAGFHADPPIMFSEEFQVEFLKRYNNVLDNLDFVIGEHIWNFADFKTKQGITRVGGNKKGVFTRDRQPKMAAHMLKERWRKK
jgi:beta-glucuronidase